ncbi:MAG: hypothetical protein DRI01_07680, partial [Chloroflexi bacterium]
MTKKLERLTKVIDCTTVGAGWVGIAAMWLLAVLIMAEILDRAIFSRSLLFTLDVSKWLLVTLVMMGGAWTLKAEGHIRISLISSRLSQRKQRWLIVAIATIGTIVFAFIASYAWKGMLAYHKMHTTTVSLVHFPLWPIWVVLFAGMVLLSLQFAATVVKNVVWLRTIQEPEERSSWTGVFAIIALVAILTGAIIFLFAYPETSHMNAGVVLVFVLVIVFGLILSSLWIFLSLTLAGILSMLIFTSYGIEEMTSKIIFNSNASFVLTCLPLFIFMGELLFRSGVSRHLYNGISIWVQRVPGKLFHSNVLACTAF